MRTNRLACSAALLVGCIVTVGVLARSASADLLVYEPFAYADSDLTGQGGALGTTGTWTAHDTHYGDWRVHQEGETAGIVVDPGPPIVRGMFDGTVDNLATSGGYAGLPGPDDTGADPDSDHEIGRNMDASIALDPFVTATFQSGTTTWISYVSARAWDRNEEHPNLVLGTDPAPTGSRGDNYGGVGAGFSGFGTGGGPTRNNRTDIYPMFYDAGQYHNTTGAILNNAYSDSAHEVPDADGFAWQEFDTNGDFGAANIVVMKLEWDADGGKDIISVARFLEADTLSESAFDALIVAQPNLSSANWDEANKPSLTQGDLDTITFMGLKYFVDEIRIATTFAEAVPGESVTPRIPGDVNNDGMVDRVDAALLVPQLGMGPVFDFPDDNNPDVDGDAFVSLSDLGTVVANQGQPSRSPAASQAPVPEPTTLTLLWLGASSLFAMRFRHRRVRSLATG